MLNNGFYLVLFFRAIKCDIIYHVVCEYYVIIILLHNIQHVECVETPVLFG